MLATITWNSRLFSDNLFSRNHWFNDIFAMWISPPFSPAPWIVLSLTINNFISTPLFNNGTRLLPLPPLNFHRQLYIALFLITIIKWNYPTFPFGFLIPKTTTQYPKTVNEHQLFINSFVNWWHALIIMFEMCPRVLIEHKRGIIKVHF